MKLHRKRDLGRCGIYCITNMITGKSYIGKSVNIYERIRYHINKLNKKDKNENRHFINSWHKYGRAAFTYTVLEDIDRNDDLLKKAELKWMLKTKSFDRRYGYNMRMDSETKCILPLETRKKMSESKIAMYAREDYDNMKHSHTYWKDNPEAKKRMAERVSKNRTKYMIDQFDKNKNFIKRWDRVKDIILENPNFKWQNIYSVCNGYKPSYMGYIWYKVKI